MLAYLKFGNFWPATVSMFSLISRHLKKKMKVYFFSFTASDRSAVNLERRLEHEGDPLAITAADAVVASGVPPWNWREAPGNGKTTTQSPGFSL